MTWDELIAEAEALGYRVELVEYCESADSPGLLGAALGVHISAKRIIRIRERLLPKDRAFVLEHELGHARIAAASGGRAEQRVYEDREYADPARVARKERISDYLYGATV